MKKYLKMSISEHDLKIITEDNETDVLTLDYSKIRLETQTKGIKCSCMCKICGCGPLAPGARGNVDLCASCRK